MEQLKAVARRRAVNAEPWSSSGAREGALPGPPMNDPLAVAVVADPEVLRTVAAPVVVETKGEYTAEIVVDLRRTAQIEPSRAILPRCA